MKTGLPQATWDSNLRQLHGSILQSRDWAAFQLRLGREVVEDCSEDWQWLASVRRSRGISYLMCAYGPVASSQGAMKRAMDSLHKSGSSLGVDFLRFEPQSVDFYNQIVKAGGRLIADLDPMYTQVIDLTASEQDLRMDLSSGHRNLINGTKRRGITISTVMVDEGLPQLTAMLADTSKRAGVTFHDEAYFQAMTEAMTGVCKIYVASVDNQPVASALFFDWQGIRYYAHAGAWQDKNREVKASVSLVWTAIMDAKKAGMHTFDLWGVAPEDDTGHKLAALSKFKRAFGGETIQYAGTYDIPLRKPKYHAYELYRKLKGLH